MSNSATTTDDDVVFPSSPGEMIREDLLEPLEMSPETLADMLCVAPDVVRAVVDRDAPIDAEFVLRLTRYFGISQGFFLRYQTSRDLRIAQHKLERELDRITPRPAAVPIAAE